MSNYLAIATVTACLQRLLQESIQLDLDGARVTTVSPNMVGSATPVKGVNLYLYQVSPNPVWQQNSDTKMRSRRKNGVKKSRTALDVYYLLSFYGNDGELEPQRLLGSTIKILSDRPKLSEIMIQKTLADSSYSYLSESDLAEQIESIHLTLIDSSLEELSKIWSVLLQTTYSLSLVYRATVLMLDGQDSAQQALPVAEFVPGGVQPFSYRPKLEKVMSTSGAFQPIFCDSTLRVQGKHLNGYATKVRIGELELLPTSVNETELILSLASTPSHSLKAGVQSLQVIHDRPSTPQHENSPSQHYVYTNGIGSNPLPFVLRPVIKKVTVSQLQGREEDLRSAVIKVRVNLTLGKHQPILLLINEMSQSNPAAYLFKAPQRRRDKTSVSIPIKEVKPGRYLVRLQVDGAESILERDNNQNHVTFNHYVSPTMRIR